MFLSYQPIDIYHKRLHFCWTRCLINTAVVSLQFSPGLTPASKNKQQSFWHLVSLDLLQVRLSSSQAPIACLFDLTAASPSLSYLKKMSLKVLASKIILILQDALALATRYLLDSICSWLLAWIPKFWFLCTSPRTSRWLLIVAPSLRPLYTRGSASLQSAWGPPFGWSGRAHAAPDCIWPGLILRHMQREAPSFSWDVAEWACLHQPRQWSGRVRKYRRL